uniref:3FTx-Thr3 n=1 Tax=Thrasops jacksonii TaxID=186611 RepID=A7X3U7_THRJA|nr:3FTx-Thr3 [Thrasops jacksonii]
MKTLLLALMVVPLVCQDSVYPDCYQCTGENCWYRCLGPRKCPIGERICYTLYKDDGKRFYAKGCARSCLSAGPGETVNCCFYSGCNRLY